MQSKRSQNKFRTILPLSLVSFFLALNYFILKVLKETLLVTAPDAGAEAIPFVKMWVLFPATIVFLAAFTRMARQVSLRFAVTVIITFFLCTYALFIFVFYPIRESLHLHSLADSLQVILPQGWRGFAAVVRYWSYTFFYVTAECWCTMVYSVVFWGYANAVMNFHDAKKYYPYLTLAGTTAALIAGSLTIFITGLGSTSLFGLNLGRWDLILYSLTGIVLFSGISALGIFLKYCPVPPSVNESGENPSHTSLEKPSFWFSITTLFRSRYLLTLALISFTYNMVINVTDVVWKNEVLKLSPNPSDFTSYLSHVTLITGIISTLFTLFVCRQSLQKFGWTKTALITPILALITGLFFFFAIITSEYGLLPVTLQTVAFLGSMHICLSCAGKYTLFEPTKEMAFIPLSSSEKFYGKAAIDGVGMRLGKTCSAMIYHILLMVLPTITACTPYVGAFLLIVLFVCMRSVSSLGQQIESKPTVS